MYATYFTVRAGTENKTDPRDIELAVAVDVSEAELVLCCATSTPTLNAWQLHQAVSYPCARLLSSFCHSEILTYVRLGP